MARHLLPREPTTLLHQAMLPTNTARNPDIPRNSNSSNSLPTPVPIEAMLLDMVNPSLMDTGPHHLVAQEAIPRREATRLHLGATK
jgi:hypothetical protein